MDAKSSQATTEEEVEISMEQLERQMNAQRVMADEEEYEIEEYQPYEEVRERG